MDGFAGVQTTDFNNERSFLGFGVNYFINSNFGVGAHSSFTDASGNFFNDLALKGIYRVPVKNSAPYAFVGGLRHFDEGEYGVTLGIGAEHRFKPWLGAYVEIAMEKFKNIDPIAIGKVGVRVPLSFGK